jgi:hypothetical protein
MIEKLPIDIAIAIALLIGRYDIFIEMGKLSNKLTAEDRRRFIREKLTRHHKGKNLRLVRDAIVHDMNNRSRYISRWAP